MAKLILLLVCATAFQFAFCLARTLTQSYPEDLRREHNAFGDGKLSATSTAMELPEKNAALSARKGLSAMIKEGDAKHLKFLLEGSNKIAKELLADPRINNADTEALKKDKAVVEQYVKDSDEALSTHSGKCIKRVLKDFYTFTNRHTLEKENHTKENDIVLAALKSHGFEQFEAEENKLLNEIGSYYADEFEKYLESLTPVEREKEKDLVYVFETNLENPGIMDRSNYGFRYRMYFSETGNE